MSDAKHNGSACRPAILPVCGLWPSGCRQAMLDMARIQLMCDCIAIARCQHAAWLTTEETPTAITSTHASAVKWVAMVNAQRVQNTTARSGVFLLPTLLQGAAHAIGVLTSNPQPKVNNNNNNNNNNEQRAAALGGAPHHMSGVNLSRPAQQNLVFNARTRRAAHAGSHNGVDSCGGCGAAMYQVVMCPEHV
jgi:hypothetical protein